MGGDLQLGAQDQVGPYTLEEELGAGGMGVVFRATGPEGTVALKIVRAQHAGDPEFRKRLAREIKIATEIQHENVVAVLDEGEHDGLPYLALNLMPGGSLADAVERDGCLASRDLVRVCSQVAAGLDAIHERGLIHRDVKPANIMFDEQGGARVTDFGLAKDPDASALTKPGRTMGSVDYMAPEQVRGEEVTPATDVYSLGCVVCECLSGAPPFHASDGLEVLWAHLRDEPPDPCGDRGDLPEKVGWAATRALAKDPGERPQTAIAYARMLKLAAAEPAG